MQTKRSFIFTSLIAVLLVNGAIFAAFYSLTPDRYASQSGMMLGIVGLLSLVLWLIIMWAGGRAINHTAARTLASIPTSPPATQSPDNVKRPSPTPTSAPVVTPSPAPEPVVPQPPDETPAIQMLAILQRKGRLIDFLQEDLSAFEDAQIGAAVRTIHEGCNEALAETVELVPVFAQPEGSTVTIEPDFDSRAIRLVGSVANDPPFPGVLRHKGWRVTSINLPERTGEGDDEMIVAAAEVEV